MHTNMIDTHPTDGVLAIEFDLMQEKNGVYGFEETKKKSLRATIKYLLYHIHYYI